MSLRLELNAASRFGDMLDEENRLVKRVGFEESLSEGKSLERWQEAISKALAREGLRWEEKPAIALPLTGASAVERIVVPLQKA